jgi:hypothetical protein
MEVLGSWEPLPTGPALIDYWLGRLGKAERLILETLPGHIPMHGTPYRDKWEATLIENCRRFAAGEPLLNVVDKEKWF